MLFIIKNNNLTSEIIVFGSYKNIIHKIRVISVYFIIQNKNNYFKKIIFH